MLEDGFFSISGATVGADGRETGRIDVPERPLQRIFGGADRARLFILTHHMLHAVRPRPAVPDSGIVVTGTCIIASGNGGLGSFSLRGLGTIRTPTPIDGQRVVGGRIFRAGVRFGFRPRVRGAGATDCHGTST